MPVHTPRACQLTKQIEIYFSIVQRKVLTPNDFATLAALEHHLLAFHYRYQTIAAVPLDLYARPELHHLSRKLDAALAQPAASA